MKVKPRELDKQSKVLYGHQFLGINDCLETKPFYVRAIILTKSRLECIAKCIEDQFCDRFEFEVSLVLYLE